MNAPPIDVAAIGTDNTAGCGRGSLGTAEKNPKNIQTPMKPADAEAYRFGPFELRPSEYTLMRDGVAEHLNPKAFDMLRLLVERHGHIVEKEGLIAFLWPDTVVEEANLSVQMAAVRKALGGTPGSDRYIETVPKRGYRFVADVEVVSSSAHQPERAVARPSASLVTIVVLPLKILRADPESDFLAFSLPDAIAASLADRPNMMVRSPLAAAGHGGAEADLTTLATGLKARFALAGTLTHVGDRIAVRLQLLELPAGTVLWSESRTTSVPEMFDLQDAVAARVALSLTASVDAGTPVPRAERDVPKSAGAYAFYLRANQLAYEVSHWAEARDLYRACLNLDPDYAPAWARLARCERLIGKFSSSAEQATANLARAEEAFHRALALNSDLSIGHSLYAQLMIDVGRADDAMRLLLERATRRPTDPELYAGLVHALRYCGLLEASVAAHVRARHLDPTLPTSIHHTWWMMGEYESALAQTLGDIGYMQGLALASLGREREAIAALRWRERETAESRIRSYLTSLRALLEGDREKSLAAAETAAANLIDSEAVFYMARTFVRLGAHDRAVIELRRVVNGGFWCYDAFMRDPWLDPIRGRSDVRQLLREAHDQVGRARKIFLQLNGPELLRPLAER
jgi:DNA-binding winged helix-turn-helix (wHTH) protein/tetratricopeptide (TPR) repeat protein